MAVEQMELWGRPSYPTATRPAEVSRKRSQRQTGTGRHINSIEARDDRAHKLSARAETILAHVRRCGPMTDREVRDDVMGAGADMNTVRPRISELIRDGYLAEIGKQMDPVSGCNVRVVAAVKRGLEG